MNLHSVFFFFFFLSSNFNSFNDSLAILYYKSGIIFVVLCVFLPRGKETVYVPLLNCFQMFSYSFSNDYVVIPTPVLLGTAQYTYARWHF